RDRERQAVQAQRRRHAGIALQGHGRHVHPGRRGDAKEPDAAPTRAARGIRCAERRPNEPGKSRLLRAGEGVLRRQGWLMTEPARLLFFAGSARRDSFNKQLARLAASIAKLKGHEATFVDFADYQMPIYYGDLEAAHGPP